MRPFVLLSLVALAGCVAQPITKPFVVCRVSDGRALIEQGIANPSSGAGAGLAQELPDADKLCAKPGT
jgi:hypothetical protein